MKDDFSAGDNRSNSVEREWMVRTHPKKDEVGTGSVLGVSSVTVDQNYARYFQISICKYQS